MRKPSYPYKGHQISQEAFCQRFREFLMDNYRLPNEAASMDAGRLREFMRWVEGLTP